MVPVSVPVMRPVRKAKRQHASLKTCFEKNEGQIRKDDELNELNPVPVPAPAPAPARKTTLTEIEGKTGVKQVSSSTLALASALSPKKIIEESSSSPCILNVYNSDSQSSSKSKSRHEQESYCHCLICFKIFPNLSEGILDAGDFQEYERMFGIVSKLLLNVNVNSDSGETSSLDYTQRQIQSSSGSDDDDENSFNFLVDPFPFCSTCQDLVVNLCLLQEDLESIREEIRVSVQDLNSMIINSSTALISTQDNQTRKELNEKNSVIINFDEKINYFRKAAVEKHRRVEPGSATGNEEETPHLPNIPVVISEEENVQEYNQDTHHNHPIIIRTASQDSAGTMNGELEIDAINTAQPDANDNTNENCNRKRKMTKTTPHSKPKVLGTIKIPRKVKESTNGIFLYEGFQFRSVGDILFECCTCDIRLKKRAMQTHIIYSHREREKYPFSCSTCAMGFETEELLQGHLKTHKSHNIIMEKIKVDSELKEASFSLEIGTECCDSCNKKFATKQDLRRHSFSHSGGVSYDCSHPNCGKSYIYHNGFQSHLKTHDVAQNRKTPKLKKQNGLGTPSRSPRQRPVYWKKCKFCGKKFAFKAAFTIHVQQAHKDVTHMEMSNSTENEVIISVSDSDEDYINDPNNDNGKDTDKNEGVPPVQSAQSVSVSNVVDEETNTIGEPDSGMCPSAASTEYITLTVNNDSNESGGTEDGGKTHLSSGNIQFHRVVLSADPVLLHHHHHSSLQETELPLLTSMPSAGNFLEVVREDPNGVHTTEIVQIVQIL